MGLTPDAVLTLHQNLHLRLCHPCLAASLADVKPFMIKPHTGDQQSPTILRDHHTIPLVQRIPILQPPARKRRGGKSILSIAGHPQGAMQPLWEVRGKMSRTHHCNTHWIRGGGMPMARQ